MKSANKTGNAEYSSAGSHQSLISKVLCFNSDNLRRYIYIYRHTHAHTARIIFRKNFCHPILNVQPNFRVSVEEYK